MCVSLSEGVCVCVCLSVCIQVCVCVRECLSECEIVCVLHPLGYCQIVAAVTVTAPPGTQQSSIGALLEHNIHNF